MNRVRCRLLSTLPMLIGLAASLTHQDARALEACIGSTSDLVNAVNNVVLTGEALTLKLRSGAFQLDGSLLTSNAAQAAIGEIDIQGGFNADCSAQTLTPSLSKLYNFNNVNPAVFKAKSNITLHNLELRGPITFRATTAGTHVVKLERVRVLESMIPQTLLFEGASNQVSLNMLVRNSVFQRNDPGATVDYGLRVAVLDTQSALTVSNSTFGTFSTAAIRFRNLKLARFYNNVFWQSPTSVLEAADAVTQADTTFVNNTLTSNALLKAPIAEGGTLTSNPMFVTPSDLHLANGSPAINTGTFFVVGGLNSIDFDGDIRVQGSFPDRGAYESVFSDLGAITVTNTNDSGAGSLRQAILDSKTQTIPITIKFNIAGGCPQHIQLLSPLPSIGKPQTTIIDGYTQPGAARNTSNFGFNGTICIFISGHANAIAYAMNNDAGTHIFTITGLGFGGFTDAAIKLNGTGAINIEGNLFGLGLPNVPAGWVKNASNIRTEGGAFNKTIGGPNPGQRNLLNSANSTSVSINNGGGNQIINNFIGIDGDGVSARGNGTGIRLSSTGHLVQGNAIAGNNGNGVFIIGGGNNNVIKDNLIGRKPGICLFCALPNGSNGISLISGASGNTLENNIVASNGQSGVRMEAEATTGTQRNRLLGNRIFDNAGMGIEIIGLLNGAQHGPNSFPGPNPINNDPGEFVFETNGGQNFPTITSITEQMDGSGLLEGTLASRNGSYRIEAFASNSCDSNGFGEGETPVGVLEGVTISDAAGEINGNASFEMLIAPIDFNDESIDAPGPLANQRITLIATDSLGNSSEFSKCVPFRDVMFQSSFE